MRKLGLAIMLFSLFVYACTKEAKTQNHFIFKPAPNDSAVAKILGEEVSYDEVMSGHEGEIYELEMKLHELKVSKVKEYALNQFIQNDKRSKGMSNEEFLDKYVLSEIKISDSEINAFAKERKIPQENLNAELKGRIEKFLAIEKKKGAVEEWMQKQAASKPVEIYLPKPQRPVFDVKVGDSPWMGGADAKVTIVEFSDFQCPFCAKGAEIIAQLKEKYGKKIKVVFKNFPLPFHTQAKQAAVAGLCAHEQGKEKFWDMHDKMFADQTKLDRGSLIETAKSIGLDETKFTSCLDSNKYLSKVEADMNHGQEVGVQSTPTFFVNGMLVNGAQPVEVFSEIIDEELKK